MIIRSEKKLQEKFQKYKSLALLLQWANNTQIQIEHNKWIKIVQIQIKDLVLCPRLREDKTQQKLSFITISVTQSLISSSAVTQAHQNNSTKLYLTGQIIVPKTQWAASCKKPAP